MSDLPEPGLPPDSLDRLRDLLRAFSAERDWDRFHAPKNLACALIVEAGELLEHFQWLTEQQSTELSPATKDAVALEMADVKEKFASAGLVPVGGSMEHFDKLIRSEMQRWGRVIRERGIKPD